MSTEVTPPANCFKQSVQPCTGNALAPTVARRTGGKMLISGTVVPAHIGRLKERPEIRRSGVEKNPVKDQSRQFDLDTLR
jgi:hypothetical protein